MSHRRQYLFYNHIKLASSVSKRDMPITRASTLKQVKAMAFLLGIYSLFIALLSPDANVLIIFTVRTMLPSNIVGMSTSIRAKRVNKVKCRKGKDFNFTHISVIHGVFHSPFIWEIVNNIHYASFIAVCFNFL